MIKTPMNQFLVRHKCHHGLILLVEGEFPLLAEVARRIICTSASSAQLRHYSYDWEGGGLPEYFSSMGWVGLGWVEGEMGCVGLRKLDPWLCLF